MRGSQLESDVPLDDWLHDTHGRFVHDTQPRSEIGGAQTRAPRGALKDELDNEGFDRLTIVSQDPALAQHQNQPRLTRAGRLEQPLENRANERSCLGGRRRTFAKLLAATKLRPGRGAGVDSGRVRTVKGQGRKRLDEIVADHAKRKGRGHTVGCTTVCAPRLRPKSKRTRESRVALRTVKPIRQNRRESSSWTTRSSAGLQRF
jgi:hypothetical protein